MRNVRKVSKPDLDVHKEYSAKIGESSYSFRYELTEDAFLNQLYIITLRSKKNEIFQYYSQSKPTLDNKNMICIPEEMQGFAPKNAKSVTIVLESK